jgi:hypothetical protein
VSTERSPAQSEARPLDALLSIALQLRARLDANDGIRRNLGNEAVLLRSFGYKNPDIAAIIGSTPASVAELISQAQKATTGPKKAKRKKQAAKSK